MAHSTKAKTKDQMLREVSAKFPQFTFRDDFELRGSKDTLIPFTCPVHSRNGEVFHETFKDLMRSTLGCTKCAGRNLTTEDILYDFKRTFPDTYDTYDWSKAKPITTRDLFEVTCPDHGVFTTSYNRGLTRERSTPCQKCNIALRTETQFDSKESFIEKISERYPGRWIWDNFVLTTSKVKTLFKCAANLEHPEVELRPNDAMNGYNCVHCTLVGTSRGQIELQNFVQDLGFETQNKFRMSNNREIDVYIPALRIGFEYNGLRYHSTEYLSDWRYHAKKTDQAISEGIRLIHIFEDDWLDEQELVKARVKSILGKSHRIFARDCEVQEIPWTTTEAFLSKVHIQGRGARTSTNLGLFKKDALVAVMTFGIPKFQDVGPGEYELVRYCSEGTVVGGASKLLSYFERRVNPKKIMTYSDRMWSVGGLYKALGFTHVRTNDPGYFYFKSNKGRFSRQSMAKHKLEELFTDFDPDKTEEQMCLEHGFFRVYDSGHDVWEKTF